MAFITSVRPSNLDRRWHCPGSRNAEEALPEITEDEKSDVASRGNRIHNAIAQGILRPSTRIALLAECDDQEIVMACWIEAEACWNGLTPDQRKRAKVLVEKHLKLDCLNIEGGTPDFAIVVQGAETEDGFIILRDWKSGQGYVTPAKWNLQLAAYAVGLMAEYGITGRADIGVVQPAVKDTVETWIASKADLDTVANKIIDIGDYCVEDNPPIIPGGWCTYCRAKNVCETRLAVAAEVKTIANPVDAMNRLVGEARKDLYEKLDKAIEMLKKAQEQIDGAIIAGQLTVPGYGAGEGRKGRFWAGSNEEAIRRLAQIANNKGLAVSDISEPISVSKAEKLLGKEAAEGFVCIKPGNPIVKRIKEK